MGGLDEIAAGLGVLVMGVVGYCLGSFLGTPGEGAIVFALAALGAIIEGTKKPKGE